MKVMTLGGTVRDATPSELARYKAIDDHRIEQAHRAAWKNWDEAPRCMCHEGPPMPPFPRPADNDDN